MILNGVYVKSDDITRTKYSDDYNNATFYRAHYSVPCEEVKIPCTREQYEVAIMYLERNMAARA